MKMIRCIPFFKTCNRQVDYIDKSYCSLTTVPEDIMRFRNTLEELYLNSNHIRELPRSFFRLTKLRKLSLHDNEFLVLPPDIRNFVYLVELDASKNEFEDIPDEISECQLLQIIDFSSTRVISLSPGVTQLRNLTTLYLNFNGIPRLPEDFGSLVNLQNLELRENDLESLPVSFRDLRNLVRLDLGHNLFKVLSPIIGQLSNLEELWLDKNELRQLPEEISALQRLQSLDATENKLDRLPKSLPESLVDLHLSKNLIEELPDGIGHLSNLAILKLDQNNLTTLNPTIGGCRSLQELMLTENSLSELPPTIGCLTNLSILNLDLNRLEKLPPDICNLTKLGIISLRNNNLTYLPNEMGQLKKLHVLDVANNQLQYLPYSITTLNLEALWLSENQSHPLLKFQTDCDPTTRQKVLTCFLLPQQKESYDSRSIENLLDSTLQRINSINWEKPKQSSTVKFFYENEVADDDELANENVQSFVRHDTPHPKELKARHQKLFNKENSTSAAGPANSTGASASGEPADHSAMQLSSANKSESESSDASSVVVRQSYENAGSNLMANKTSTVQNLNKIDDNMIEDMLDNYLDMQRNNLHQSYELDAPQYELDAEQYQAELNQDDYTMEGKHVIFPESEYNENDVNSDNDEQQPPRYAGEPQHNKLHRRDTPHHLKNKRINSMTNKADADKVASILDKLNNQFNHDLNDGSSLKTSSSSVNSHHNPIASSAFDGQASYQPLRSTLENPPTASYQHDTVAQGPYEVKQLLFHLTRSPQYGLGLSIAGGRGSTPYKNNDESIFVSNVGEKTPAFTAGLLKGDKILKVNDCSLEGAEHYKAVRVFRLAGEQFSVLISREVPIAMFGSSSTNLALNASQTCLPPASMLSSTSLTSNPPQQPFLPISYTSTLNSTLNSALTSNGGIRNLAFDDRLPTTNSGLAGASNHLSNEPQSAGSLVNNNNERDAKIQYATLIRDHNGIGITVAYDEANNVCVDTVQRASSADGKILEGDRLVSINGKDIRKLNMTIEDVEAILNSGERFIRIVVERN